MTHFVHNSRVRGDGLKMMARLEPAGAPLVILDPQYRGVLDHLAYGNEGARQRERAALPQMDDRQIARFIAEIDRILRPSGHLLLWVDKFHLCTGLDQWLDGTALEVVDLIVWHKRTFGMGYRTRRVSEYLAVLQKVPRRAKGHWKAHNIPDVWTERAPPMGPHAKPLDLQRRLIEALTDTGDTVIDPAAGGYSVLEACRLADRNFLGCDIA
jgi:site-specific DNA-methyltransferase (adenine-specific)